MALGEQTAGNVLPWPHGVGLTMGHRRAGTVAITVEQSWQRVPGGSGTYVAELTRALSELGTVSLVGLTARHGHADVVHADVEPVVHRIASSHLARSLMYESWNRLSWPRAERIAGDDVDVVHATTWAVPPTRKPLVVTVHDVAFVENPSHFTPRGVRYFKHSLERTRTEAARIIVPSLGTFESCVAVGLPASKLRVVQQGVRVVPPTKAQVASFQARHGLRRPYVFWCGTLEPRKNLRTLLAAYEKVQGRLGDHDLVLAGPEGWGNLQLDGDRSSDRVHRLGRLSPSDLACAYAGSDVFCFPSLAEGFGMPVLEAMAHGVPVVTSLGTPMEEIVGDAGLAVEPTDASALADALVAVARHRSTLSSIARDRSRAYSWQTAARRTAEVYDELM